MAEGKQLYRSCKNRIIGGVCGGLGEYFDLDPVLIRLVFVLLAIPGGVGLWVYIVAWLIIPQDPTCLGENGKTGKEDIKEKAEALASEIKKSVKENKRNRNDDGRIIGGLVLLALGVIFLAQNVFGWNLWSNFWPLILILVGFIIILNGSKK